MADTKNTKAPSTSSTEAMRKVRQASLGGAKLPQPQFGVTKLPVFGITDTMRKCPPK